jgi:hypothetical protein
VNQKASTHESRWDQDPPEGCTVCAAPRNKGEPEDPHFCSTTLERAHPGNGVPMWGGVQEDARSIHPHWFSPVTNTAFISSCPPGGEQQTTVGGRKEEEERRERERTKIYVLTRGHKYSVCVRTKGALRVQRS